MNRRPASVTAIGWIFIGVGLVSLGWGGWRFLSSNASGSPAEIHDFVYVAVSAAVAVAGGVLALRGSNWGRGLLTLWIVLHVILAAHHEIESFIVHGLLFVVALLFLFRPAASAYFRSR